MAADGMDLGDQRDVGAGLVRLDRGAHARQSSADHENVVLGLHKL
jgi:hypothetical protein